MYQLVAQDGIGDPIDQVVKGNRPGSLCQGQQISRGTHGCLGQGASSGYEGPNWTKLHDHDHAVIIPRA